LDRVVHAVYVIVCFLAKVGVGKADWGRNNNKNNGQHDFQIDLGIALMNNGISLEWNDTTQTRPNFIRQTAFVPCDCRKCFLVQYGCGKQSKVVYNLNHDIMALFSLNSHPELPKSDPALSVL
jgi:hypothetical protein